MPFFFFTGGVTPKVVTERVPEPCPVCGTPQTIRKRVDHVLNVFMIPLCTVHKGQPYRFCERCGWDERGLQYQLPPVVPPPGVKRPPELPTPVVDVLTARRCPNCNSPVDPSFAFCPFCGTPLGSKPD